MFTNILWATDGSEHANRALSHAVALAREDNARLHVVHVREKVLAGRGGVYDRNPNEDETIAKIKAEVGRLRRKSGVETTLEIATDHNVPHRIVEIADEVGADLIVVGTRGHSALADLLLGSVTQGLLHISERPVLAVPPRAARADEKPVGTVATTS